MRTKFCFGMAILALGLWFLLMPERAFATFSLSVSPYEGGYDLRFGNINLTADRANKEVTVSVNSTIGKQYRIIQTLLDPISNAQGITIAQNNFFVYGIRGTNKFGTLGVEQEVPVNLGRTIIYTSNTSGTPDSFTLVYSLKGPLEVPPGSYRGRISFTLEPIDTTQAAVRVILNIFAEAEAQSSIEVKTSTGSKTITLSSAREEQQAEDVLVNIKGGMGSQFKIVQSIREGLVSSEGNQLSEGAVNVMVKEARKGTGLSSATNLSSQRQTLYTSGLRGEAESFIVTYSLGDLSKEKAGRYRTSLKYLLESTGYAKESIIETLALEVENERVFDLIVTPEMGGTLQFRDLKPQQPPRINEVVLAVKTNIAKPYQVSQGISSPFTNREGKTIAGEYFTLKTESLDAKGVLKYPNKTEVKIGDAVLFVSDKFGSADSFKVIYELAIPPDLHAGDYSTRITYTISEI